MPTRTTLTPATIASAARNAPTVVLCAEHEGDGDARQHAVGERLAEEAHAAQHDPRADERRAQRREQHRPQRRAHELVVGERLDPPRPRIGEEVHGVTSAEGVGDGGGVEAHQVGVGLGAGALLAERVGVERHDVDAEAVGERRRVVGRTPAPRRRSPARRRPRSSSRAPRARRGRPRPASTTRAARVPRISKS